MDFSLTDQHVMVRDMVRNFAEREVAPRIKELNETHTFDRRYLDRMGELGILGICIPEEYGGAGFDHISLAIASEELERVDTFLRVIVSVHVGLCSMGILQWGTEEQKRRHLLPLAQGKRIGGFGLTEPNAGSDVAGIQTTAVRDGDHYVLNGEKTWISLAEVADTFLVFAYTDRAQRHEGITAFIVERDTPGFESYTIKGKMGIHAGNTGGFVLSNCRVPAADRLGEEGEGFKIAMSCIDNGRLTVAGGNVGLAQACLEASVKYAHERQAFGREIGKFQLVQRMISHMVVGTESARLLTYRAAWLKNQGVRNTRETSLAKWHACNVSVQSANDAIEIHGAYGYSDEYPVERYFRNARAAMIYEGTREIHEVMQAEYALGYRTDKPLRRELPGWPFRPEGKA